MHVSELQNLHVSALLEKAEELKIDYVFEMIGRRKSYRPIK